MLLVEGKVRLGNDEVQLSCDSVRDYQPEVAPAEVPVPSEATVAPTAAEKPPAAEVGHRLVINLTQSDNKDSDLERLQRVIDTLKEFPGHDQVRLQVTYESRVTHLRLPDLTTSYCAELGERLAELVGEAGIKVE